MKPRDALAIGAGLVSLVGIGGQFGMWWALIVGGIAGVALLVGLTLADLKAKPRSRRAR